MATDGWQDMGLYWGWRGTTAPTVPPPTKKRIGYATIDYDPVNTNSQLNFRIAAVVSENEAQRLVNVSEIEWHQKNGATITMPNMEALA
jgi:hypothetical protein